MKTYYLSMNGRPCKHILKEKNQGKFEIVNQIARADHYQGIDIEEAKRHVVDDLGNQTVIDFNLDLMEEEK